MGKDFVLFSLILLIPISKAQWHPLCQYLFDDFYPAKVYDNKTDSILEYPSVEKILSEPSIENTVLKSLVNISWNETYLEISPNPDTFGDYLDDNGNPAVMSSGEDGLHIEFESFGLAKCRFGLHFNDTNNQPPVFNGPKEFKIPKTWDKTVPLNWNIRDPLTVTDKDHTIDNARVTLTTSNPGIRAEEILRDETETPPNLHMYDVQLFLDDIPEIGPATYLITASDGKHETDLEVIIEVFAENLNPPVFENTGYHHEFADMPKSGTKVPLTIKANDPDDPNTEIEYSIPIDNEFLTIDSTSGELEITKAPYSKAGEVLTVKVKAKEVATPPREVEVDVTLRFPELKAPTFSEDVYQKTFSDLPAKDDELVTVGATVGDEGTVEYSFGVDEPPQSFLDIDSNTGVISFNADVDENADLGKYKENGVIIFTVMAEASWDNTFKTTSKSVVMAAFPLDKLNPPPPGSSTTTTEGSESTTTTEASDSTTTCQPCEQCTTTTQQTGPTEPDNCPSTTTSCPPCEGSSSSTDSSSSSTDPSDSSSSSTTDSCPPCSTECPPISSTTDSGSCPPCSTECPSISSTTDSGSCPPCSSSSTNEPSSSSTTDSGLCPPCSTECPSTSSSTNPTTCPEPECPISSEVPCITDPPDCSSNGPPSSETCPPCDTSSTPDSSYCPPCSTTPPGEGPCPPCECDCDENPSSTPEPCEPESCSKTGLIAALIATSIFSAASLCVGGYLVLQLRKALIDPARMPRDSIIPDIEGKKGSGFDSHGYQRFDDASLDPSPTPSENGNENPTFSLEDEGNGSLGQYENPSEIMESPKSHPESNQVQFQETPSTSVATTATASQPKSIMKTPKEIEPDYEEAPEQTPTTSEETEPKENSSRERKQSRVLFEEDYASVDDDPKVGEDKAKVETNDNDSEDERL